MGIKSLRRLKKLFKKYSAPHKSGRRPLIPEMAIGEKVFINSAFSTIKTAALRIYQQTGQEFEFEKILNGYIIVRVK